MGHPWRITRARLGVLVTGVALVAGLVFVVLPALASTAGQPVPPPSAAGVLPIDVNTGGQSNDCSVFNSTAKSAYRIANPKSQKYTTTVNGAQVSFTLQLNPADAKSLPAYGNQKYIDVTDSSGAAIADIGIKGGTDETDYKYSPGAVTKDAQLHAPAQSTAADGTPIQLYAISNLTFCFDPLTNITGTVFHDGNVNGANDDGTTQDGWTVSLYDDTSAPPIKTTTTAGGGKYTLSTAVSAGKTYTICEQPPSGSWAQTQPSPSSANVCPAPNLPKGYTFTSASGPQTGKDFGNIESTPCGPGPFGPDSYKIQFGQCKPNESYVFSSGTTPAGKPFVSVWPSDQANTTLKPLVEKITWPYDPTKGQNQFQVLYTDVFPFDATKLTTMQYCKVDPRDGSDDFTLTAHFQDAANRGEVLPGTETSCLVSTTEAADGSFTAIVYSDVDGFRSTT